VPRIHPSAVVVSGAELADDVEIGPYCTVGPNVELRSGVRLMSHVNVDGHTLIKERTTIYPFASLGTPPQSLSYRGSPTRLTIGEGCVIRESVTMNTGTEDGGGITVVGDRGFFMAYSHVGHDCRVGNDVVFANCAALGGHCIVDDYVFIGGLTAVHQHTRIGAQAMLGGMSLARGDIIPYGLMMTTELRGVNITGMRRRKLSRDTIDAVRAAYKRLFFGAGTFAQRVDATEAELGGNQAVAQIVAFIRGGHNRPLCLPGKRHED
jgi:UDP-N-acetylglucosamine acyltransferase